MNLKELVQLYSKWYSEMQNLDMEGSMRLQCRRVYENIGQGVIIIQLLNRFTNQSIRFKLIVGLLVFVVPLLIFLIFNSYYAIGVVRAQVAKSNENLTTLYMDQIDRNLEEVDKYLRLTAAFESDLLPLSFLEDHNSDQYQFAKINLFNRMENDYVNYKFVDLLFVYSAVNDDIVTNAPPEIETTELKIMKEWMRAYLKNEENLQKYRSGKWYVHEERGKYYLLDIKSIGNVYMGSVVEASKLMIPLSLLELGQDGRAMLMTEQQEPMTNNYFFEEEGRPVAAERQNEVFTDKKDDYLQVSKQSSQGNFSMLIQIPYRTILERLPDLGVMSSIILIGSLIIFPIFYIFLRHIILVPISRIMTVMRRVRDGNLEYRVEKYPVSSEFALMNDVFNSMVSQIKELKINVYEEQLLTQRAELKHLQLQINPHFFLNALNTIYNLAQFKNYSLIQEMSSYMIQYMRFMFQSNLKFVSLADEISHTRNYLHIQAMRFHEGFTYDMTPPAFATEVQVPPLIIQTFAENTVKHAITMDEAIHLSVEMQLYGEDEQYLQIVIRDTGEGFPQRILQDLQLEHAYVSEEREHIGIWNARRRLRLLYHEEAKLTLSNHEDGGAQVEIILPLAVRE